MTQSAELDLVAIGQIKSAYGIKGWVWIYSHTDPITNIFTYQPWMLASSGQHLRVQAWRQQGQGLIALFDGVSSRNDAERFMGQIIQIDKKSLPKANKDEHYWSDLIGMAVYGQGAHGERVFFGTVSHLFETAAHDVMVVESDPNSIDTQQRMIPWHQTTIIEVHAQKREIDVQWGVDY